MDRFDDMKNENLSTFENYHRQNEKVSGKYLRYIRVNMVNI